MTSTSGGLANNDDICFFLISRIFSRTRKARTGLRLRRGRPASISGSAVWSIMHSSGKRSFIYCKYCVLSFRLHTLASIERKTVSVEVHRDRTTEVGFGKLRPSNRCGELEVQSRLSSLFCCVTITVSCYRHFVEQLAAAYFSTS